MPKLSAGLLIYRLVDRDPEVLLVHPGGPFWARKDAGAWSVPKGEHSSDEDPINVAEREFIEELGRPPPSGERWPLGTVVQSGGKHVQAWAIQGDLDVSEIRSNTFEIEWPKGSGRSQSFPEVDKAAWFALDQARTKILPSQRSFLERLAESLPESQPKPGNADPETGRPGV